MKEMKDQNAKDRHKLSFDINAEQYSNLNTRQLGNHFIYSKIDSNQKWNDPRLKVINSHYFINKTIVDIGCNEGILTIPIAIKYQPKIIHGIDIDRALCKRAQGNINQFINKNSCFHLQKTILQDIDKLPMFFKEKIDKYSKKIGINLTMNDIHQKTYQIDQSVQIRPKNVQNSHIFPQNIQIIHDNILEVSQNRKYQCILCMNITKWIHLAFGDQGIKKLFHNIQKMSQAGSFLILQSQPWSSYRKKKNLYDSYTKNYKMICQKPDKFKDYLAKLQFQLIQTISPTSANNLKHQILIFRKKN